MSFIVAALADLLRELDPDRDRRGKQFERICKWYLEHDPVYAGQLTRVWLWKDWPAHAVTGDRAVADRTADKRFTDAVDFGEFGDAHCARDGRSGNVFRWGHSTRHWYSLHKGEGNGGASSCWTRNAAFKAVVQLHARTNSRVCQLPAGAFGNRPAWLPVAPSTAGCVVPARPAGGPGSLLLTTTVSRTFGTCQHHGCPSASAPVSVRSLVRSRPGQREQSNQYPTPAVAPMTVAAHSRDVTYRDISPRYITSTSGRLAGAPTSTT